MFIVYFNLIAVSVAFSRDHADAEIERICWEQNADPVEFMVDYVDEDEDLYYSIVSRS